MKISSVFQKYVYGWQVWHLYCAFQNKKREMKKKIQKYKKKYIEKKRKIERKKRRKRKKFCCEVHLCCFVVVGLMPKLRLHLPSLVKLLTLLEASYTCE